MEPRKEVPRESNRLTKMVKKATTLEKGKWVPRVVHNTADFHNEQLPSTSSNKNTDTPTKTTATQRPKQPSSGTNPLDVVKKLVFIIRTFNSKMRNGSSSWHPRLQVKNPRQQKPLD